MLKIFYLSLTIVAAYTYMTLSVLLGAILIPMSIQLSASIVGSFGQFLAIFIKTT